MHTLRLALLGLAACVAIILGWAYWHEAARGPASVRVAERQASPQEIAAMRRAIERTVAGTPDYSGFFEALKAGFPAEYEAFLVSAAERAANAGESSSADALMIEAARGLRRSHGILAAKADGPTLDRYFDARYAMLHALAANDQALCVAFLYGGGRADFTGFTRDHRTLLAALAAAGLDAISDGKDKRGDRERPTEEDFHTLENALRAQGVSNAAITTLLDGKVLNPPLSDGEMCQAGETYLKTLAALPEAPRRRIYGFAIELMARS
ncbi:hypothetical protein [Methylocella silvestris]|uniref:Uncharacterized protein n=1 Tax=Methylocella silvestris TaxID=199596 RepID=A0A2J7TII3_METSI|nr:hypothetical protein [Methylocella silvestris]PNG26582.1 hypothetical protein CR492_07815 [Methylocella silvestris]